MAGADFIYAGSLADLKRKGRRVLRGAHRPILLISHGESVFALDNRCPHMGFPLERGSCEDGILTCHWHHARFDLASGSTFDLWADDVPACPVEIRGEEIWVKPSFGHADAAAHWRRQLEEGMAHNLGLVIAKALQGQLAAGASARDIICQAALFGAAHREDWGAGMTILTALANVIDMLPKEDVYLALFNGVRRVAEDCDGAAMPRPSEPLASRPDAAVLKRWLRRWSSVRHRSAAQRTVLSAVAQAPAPAVLADLLLSAETDRVFADSGHSLDFINKCLECLDLIGWQHAARLVPTVVGQMVAARGADESTQWRTPIDLIALCEKAGDLLRTRFAPRPQRGSWTKHARLARLLLGDDPNGIMHAVESAWADGAALDDLGRALAYAAALRVAQFGTANEHADWESAHHVFTYCNAVHQELKRIGSDPDAPTLPSPASGEGKGGEFPDAVRAVLHGAMAIYLTRYLNVPPAAMPGEGNQGLDDLPATAEDIRAALLDAFDRQHQVERAARLVARHLTLGHAPESIITALGHALLREDAGFHAYQMFEAGVRQFQAWGNGAEGRHILIAVTRYLSAHSPTERAWLQTAGIAARLARGEELHGGT